MNSDRGHFPRKLWQSYTIQFSHVTPTCTRTQSGPVCHHWANGFALASWLCCNATPVFICGQRHCIIKNRDSISSSAWRDCLSAKGTRFKPHVLAGIHPAEVALSKMPIPIQLWVHCSVAYSNLWPPWKEKRGFIWKTLCEKFTFSFLVIQYVLWLMKYLGIAKFLQKL